MAAHSVDSSFPFPGVLAASARAERIPASHRRPLDNGLGALRGLVFALAFEAALGLVGFSGFELWRLLR